MPSRGDTTSIHGSVALVEPLPAPDDLDPQRGVSGTSICGLCGRGLVRLRQLDRVSGAGRCGPIGDRAYRRALKEATERSTAAGGTKPNAMSTLFRAADANRRRWAVPSALFPRPPGRACPSGTAPSRAGVNQNRAW